MKVREIRQLIHDKDDEVDIEFAAGGECVVIEASLWVPEWNTIYLGLDQTDINEAIVEQGLADEDGPGDDDEEEDDAPWVQDREEFMKALQKAEDVAPLEDMVCGGVCTLPPPKIQQVLEETCADTEMM